VGKLSFYDKELRPWPNSRLTSALIVGHTTTDSARIWVRSQKPGEYWLIVSPGPIDTAREPIVRHQGGVPHAVLRRVGTEDHRHPIWKLDMRGENDFTDVADVTGLTPETEYHCAVFPRKPDPFKWEVGYDQSQPICFRTMRRDPSEVVFGFHSCHMPYKSENVHNMDMWSFYGQQLAAEKADFLIAGGDQVYTDGDGNLNIWKWLRKVKREGPTLEDMKSWYRDIYRGYWGFPQVQQVLRQWPSYMIWDDHEIMDGWGSYEERELSDRLDTILEIENRSLNLTLAKRMFRAAKKVYTEYQHSHNPRTPSGQWDYSFTCGHAAFYVWDMRGHREFERDACRVLGERQRDRFLRWLAKPDGEAAHASALFVVSPVPVVHANEFLVNTLDITLIGLADDLRDEWAHDTNLGERDVLLDALFDWSQRTGRKVVFLSGDVHVGAAFRLMRDSHPRAKVFQLTSSAITYAKTPPGLTLLVKSQGELRPPKGSQTRTLFRKLHDTSRNNFAIVRSRLKSDGEVAIDWSLCGTTTTPRALVKLETVSI
jgi:alkaline phosphatase D